MEKVAKKVNEYFKFMQEKLKEWYGKDKKSPLQLPKKERDLFFSKIKKEWKKAKK